jgi:hypothetical protein
MVKVTLGPGHPFAIGVTVMVAVTGALVAFVAMNDGISPLPAAARPIEVVLLVQLYTVPNTGPVKCTSSVAAPLQSTWFAGTGLTLGVGLTVTVAVILAPTQPLADGVIVKVTSWFTNVLLVNVPVIGVPPPLVGIPVTLVVLSLIHVYVVPATVLVSTIGVIAVPEQIDWLAGVAVAIGVGFTVIVKLVVGPVQVIPPLV